MALPPDKLHAFVDPLASTWKDAAGKPRLKIRSSNARAEDLHRAFFVWRRADALGPLHEAWLSEPDWPKLDARLASEDGLVVRMFEYPRFPAKRLEPVIPPARRGPANSSPLDPSHDTAHTNTGANAIDALFTPSRNIWDVKTLRPRPRP